MATIDALSIPETADKYLVLLVKLVLVFNLIRLAYQMADAVGRMLVDVTSKTETTLDDELVPFATKSLKVFVVIFGSLIAIQNFGINVMSILAGLGLGGLALALAAQDTAANLFGSITILMDRPLKIGDWIKVTDVEGQVEEVGFRSTRIRTPYGSLVTIPNATMAKEKIDNMGTRNIRRIRHLIGVTYETPPQVMQNFMKSIEDLIRQIPEVDKETITVRFNAMNDFNLQILVNFFVHIQDISQEMEIQQRVLFQIMDLAKRHGVDFAFPTTTQYVKHLTSAAPSLGASPQA
jgi:MscS family membrane protein